MAPYFGQDTASQLASIFSGMGLDDFGRQMFGVDTIANDQELRALGAEVLAADYLYGADAPQTQAAKATLVKRAATRAAPARQLPGASNMPALQAMALAHAAGKTTFDTTSESNSTIKHERLPVQPTTIPGSVGATLLAPTATQFNVRPTRSMQINRIAFPSIDAATAACVLISVQILGIEQLNGPGGIPCALMTEVETAPNLKGSTAQAGQDIALIIGNTTATDQIIRGAFSGPDIVRST
jgi:hypothetical protein